MATSEKGFADRLIGQEISRLVADAAQDGGIISTSEAAAQILRAYGAGILTETEIADRIIMVAATAGVAVQIDHPWSFDGSGAGADNG